jgi:hypothetical protein
LLDIDPDNDEQLARLALLEEEIEDEVPMVPEILMQLPPVAVNAGKIERGAEQEIQLEALMSRVAESVIGGSDDDDDDDEGDEDLLVSSLDDMSDDDDDSDDEE